MAFSLFVWVWYPILWAISTSSLLGQNLILFTGISFTFQTIGIWLCESFTLSTITCLLDQNLSFTASFFLWSLCWFLFRSLSWFLFRSYLWLSGFFRSDFWGSWLFRSDLGFGRFFWSDLRCCRLLGSCWFFLSNLWFCWCFWYLWLRFDSIW